MLEIGVDHRHDGSLPGQHALDAGRGQAAAADPLDAAEARILAAERPRFLGRAVRRVVVDEDHLEGNVLERGLQLLRQRPDVRPLLEGGRDHGELRRRQGRAEAEAFMACARVHRARAGVL